MIERFYLTVGPHPKNPKQVLAVITDESTEQEHDDMTVLAQGVFEDENSAFEWYARLIIEQSWKIRQ